MCPHDTVTLVSHVEYGSRVIDSVECRSCFTTLAVDVKRLHAALKAGAEAGR